MRIRVVIEGPPGAGKSTVGAYFANGLRGQGIDVLTDEPGINDRLRKGPGRTYRSLAKMRSGNACIQIVEVQTNPTEGSHEESSES